MAYSALITATELKTLIQEFGFEIDDAIINNHIQRYQDMKIRPLMKSYSWYEELMFQNSGGTLSTSNEFVLDNYLKLILALYVEQKMIITQSYHVERAGLRIKRSDVSDLANVDEIRYVRQTIQDELDYLKGEFHKYVCEYSSNYPLYQNDTDPRRATKDYPRRINNFGLNISKI